MNAAEGLQFFVLDVSVILMALTIIALFGVLLYLFKKHREQKKLYDALSATVDRILEIADSGGIDGREVALKERKRKENAREDE